MDNKNLLRNKINLRRRCVTLVLHNMTRFSKRKLEIKELEANSSMSSKLKKLIMS